MRAEAHVAALCAGRGPGLKPPRPGGRPLGVVTGVQWAMLLTGRHRRPKAGTGPCAAESGASMPVAGVWRRAAFGEREAGPLPGAVANPWPTANLKFRGASRGRPFEGPTLPAGDSGHYRLDRVQRALTDPSSSDGRQNPRRRLPSVRQMAQTDGLVCAPSIDRSPISMGAGLSSGIPDNV